jgi:hypothetical protein
MPEFKTTNIDLLVDNKTIQIKNAQKGNFALNKALTKPAEFKKFVADPKAFAATFGLDIDKDVALKLADMASGFGSLDELKTAAPDMTVAATAWAVASGSYSIASSKIAVAF